jgi:hypothetical protein
MLVMGYNLIFKKLDYFENTTISFPGKNKLQDYQFEAWEMTKVN